MCAVKQTISGIDTENHFLLVKSHCAGIYFMQNIVLSWNLFFFSYFRFYRVNIKRYFKHDRRLCRYFFFFFVFSFPVACTFEHFRHYTSTKINKIHSEYLQNNIALSRVKSNTAHNGLCITSDKWKWWHYNINYSLLQQFWLRCTRT